ncbi:MAG: chemotaxis protein CheA [Nitrospirota bacterium]|nr:chemotaxis protein CheA [Nitrospirota bacterium]
MKDQHQEAFKEEARELLVELETSLLDLEKRPDDADLVGRVFRAMHTIKGTGAMFGFEAISIFTHEVETVYDLVRNGSIPVTKELIDLTLSARDHIRSMLGASGGAQEEDKGEGRRIITALRRLILGRPAAAEAGPLPPPIVADFQPKRADKKITCRIHFRPPRDIASRGLDPLGVLNELCWMGECAITARTQDVPPLDELNAETCYLCWDVVLTTRKKLNDVEDVFLFIQDDAEVKIDLINSDPVDHDEAGLKNPGDIHLERGEATPELVRQGLPGQKRSGRELVEMGAPQSDTVAPALAEQRHLKAQHEKKQAKDPASSIRVSSDKLDKLVDLVGELVTLQSLLSQTAGLFKKTKIPAIAEAVERLTAELRDITMGIRMLPIGSTFSRFQRLVRDLSREMGKEIELTTDGAETELDKTVIEKLGDPLVHILRNSIDHGIEQPGNRVAANKPRIGTVHLSAKHSGAHVLVQVRDDGKGLDPDAIRAKAVGKGLIASDAKLTEKDLFALILDPGFSTAEKVTSVSGRGVGMDVVKRAIDSLRGSIEISSRKGAGTTITLKLPLTLAIIEGLLVKIGAESFIMPLSLVEECVELTRMDIQKANGRDLAHVRGKIVPYIRLREQFRITGERPPREQIVIVSIEGRRAGFVVDRVVGGHQTVIKNLGSIYKDIDGISGATILGDGAVALILDAPRLIQQMENEEQTALVTKGTKQTGKTRQEPFEGGIT